MTEPGLGNGMALAVPGLTDKQIRTRLEVAKQPGYGLDEATPPQLNLIYLLCQRYRLDPLFHITLFRGRPWVTIDGRIELAKRHPEYRGFRTRPLSKDEKVAWDYRPDDLVVECTISTKSWGDISSRGKVTMVERQKSSPTGSNPQEMAEKRAIARAARLAFGQSAYLDEDEAEQEAIERADPERNARLAQRHREIFDGNGDIELSPAEDARARQAIDQAERDIEERDRLAREEWEQQEQARQKAREGLL
jgi:RecT family